MSRIFGLQAALGGALLTTGYGRRAVVTGYFPKMKWGLLVKSGSDKWVVDSFGRPIGHPYGNYKDQIFMEGGRDE